MGSLLDLTPCLLTFPSDGLDEFHTTHVERSLPNSLHLSSGEWPRPSFTAGIERYTCSFQARSLSLQGWGLIDLLLRATFSPAHPLPRRDVPLARARGFLSFYPF